MFMVDMVTHHSFSPELQAELDKQARERSDTLPPDAASELTHRMVVEARQRATAATRAERERLVRVHTDSLLAHMGFLAPFARLFVPGDQPVGPRGQVVDGSDADRPGGRSPGQESRV